MDLRRDIVPKLLERYAEHNPVVGTGHVLVTFPACVEGFGDVDVCDYGDDEVTVYVGRFTHFHEPPLYDVDQTDEERTEWIVGSLHWWLDALFDDRVAAHGSHEAGGSCTSIEPGAQFEDAERVAGAWVWSGPLTP